MNLRRSLKHITTAFLVVILAAGCSGLRPEKPVPLEDQSPQFIIPTLLPVENKPAETPGSAAATEQVNCQNQLVWLNDLTIPDGTQVTPGFQMDKQWQIKTAGTCNWNEKYSLRLTAGVELGATSPQALVPARGGTEAVLQIHFVAPTEPGRYRSAWQAFSPDGTAFGDPVFIEIVVTSQ